MKKLQINASQVASYKPREEASFNHSDKEKALYKAGFKVLHVKTKTEESSGGYYRAIMRLFLGNQARYFLPVITRLELDYKGYQMPTRKEFSAVLASIKRDEQTEERLNTPRLEYDPTLSEYDLSGVRSEVDKWFENHK